MYSTTAIPATRRDTRGRGRNKRSDRHAALSGAGQAGDRNLYFYFYFVISIRSVPESATGWIARFLGELIDFPERLTAPASAARRARHFQLSAGQLTLLSTSLPTSCHPPIPCPSYRPLLELNLSPLSPTSRAQSLSRVGQRGGWDVPSG